MSDTAITTQPVNTESIPNDIELEQATIDDIRERQLLYIRGKRSIVTCMDYPLVFWRNLNTDYESVLAASLASTNPLDVAACGRTLSSHYFISTITSDVMTQLVSDVELHRSYIICPEIFQIDPRDRMALTSTYNDPYSNYANSYQVPHGVYGMEHFEEDFTFHDSNFTSYSGDHSSDDENEFAFDDGDDDEDEEEVQTNVHTYDATIDVDAHTDGHDEDLFALVAEQSTHLDDITQSLDMLAIAPVHTNLSTTAVESSDNVITPVDTLTQEEPADDEWEATFD